MKINKQKISNLIKQASWYDDTKNVKNINEIYHTCISFEIFLPIMCVYKTS